MPTVMQQIGFRMSNNISTEKSRWYV